jgi:hypothetical protein
MSSRFVLTLSFGEAFSEGAFSAGFVAEVVAAMTFGIPKMNPKRNPPDSQAKAQMKAVSVCKARVEYAPARKELRPTWADIAPIRIRKIKAAQPRKNAIMSQDAVVFRSSFACCSLMGVEIIPLLLANEMFAG